MGPVASTGRPGTTRTVVCVGDSSTRGRSSGDTWPSSSGGPARTGPGSSTPGSTATWRGTSCSGSTGSSPAGRTSSPCWSAPTTSSPRSTRGARPSTAAGSTSRGHRPSTGTASASTRSSDGCGRRPRHGSRCSTSRRWARTSPGRPTAASGRTTRRCGRWPPRTRSPSCRCTTGSWRCSRPATGRRPSRQLRRHAGGDVHPPAAAAVARRDRPAQGLAVPSDHVHLTERSAAVVADLIGDFLLPT